MIEKWSYIIKCKVLKLVNNQRQLSPNKNIMVGLLLAEKALLKSPYVKRYEA
jgi:hypothetical protein